MPNGGATDMVAPLIMLAAQLYSKREAEKEARRKATRDLMKQRAQMLGGNTMGIDAANFNRELSEQSYASPQELMSIYGAIEDGKDARKEANDREAAGNLSPNESAYSLVEPESPRLKQPRFLEDDPDPYYLRRMKLR